MSKARQRFRISVLRSSRYASMPLLINSEVGAPVTSDNTFNFSCADLRMNNAVRTISSFFCFLAFKVLPQRQQPTIENKIEEREGLGDTGWWGELAFATRQ
jgi:hypothetical protein